MNYQEAYQKLEGIEGWFSVQQTEVIYPFIESLDKNALLVEIGTYHGRSAKLFSLANPDIKILTIDLMDFPEKPENVGSKIDINVLKSGNIFQVLGDANDVVKGFNWQIDFLFIDGDHSYQAVRKDIDKWLPFLKDNSYVGFHDYEDSHHGVIKAVEETKGIKKIIAKDGICICQKYGNNN